VVADCSTKEEKKIGFAGKRLVLEVQEVLIPRKQKKNAIRSRKMRTWR
jgi:hypothetical protein